METKPQFWSSDFIAQFVDKMNHDASFQKTAADFSNTVVFRCLDAPGSRDVIAAYHIDEGYVSVDISEDAAPSPVVRDAPFNPREALARATAPYAVWEKLDRGEMTAVGALASPEYVIEGPRLKIMLNMGIFNAMSAVSAGIDKRY